MDITRIEDALSKYLPEGTADTIAQWVVLHKVHFRVAKDRKSKLGDYKFDRKKKKHYISVNKSLNKYAFLITTVHEFAHLEAFLKNGFSISPHGKEWKNEMKQLLYPFLSDLPDDIQLALTNYLNNPKASSCSDAALNRVLRRYDLVKKTWLEEVPLRQPFELRNTIYVAEEKRRTRYLCREQNTGKMYLIHAQAEVSPLKERD